MGVKLTFLGTSAGAPTRKRNVSALSLVPENSKGWLLFDCGEATQHRLMQSSLSLYRLQSIFITHLHGDHIYGIFGLLASRGMMDARTPLKIYGPAGLQEMIESVRRYSRLELPFELKYRILEGGERMEFDTFTIESIKLSHSIETLGYVYTERAKPGRFDIERASREKIPRGPLYGALQRGEDIVLPDGREFRASDFTGAPREGKRIVIGGDNDSPELFEAFADVDLMIHEATYTQKDFDSLPKKFLHSTARRVAISAQRMGAKSLILTHISPRYDSEERVRELIREAEAHYDGELKVAYDLMSVEL